MLLFAAIVVAVLTTAVVDWLGITFRMGRKLAFFVILTAGPCFCGVLIWFIGPRVIDQFANLQADLPRATHELAARVELYSWGRWLLAQLSSYSQLSSNVSSALGRIGGIVLSTATVLSGIVLVGILGLYFAAEPELYFSFIQRVTPSSYRPAINACAAAAVQTLRWWVVSQMLSMTSVGVIVGCGLWALGIPLAFTLGAIAALLTFIPNIGPILSVVPAVLLAIAISPTKGLLTVLLFMAVHFLEGNVITPLLERRIVHLPPALTMTTQLLLAVIAGPLGLVLAAPFTAVALGVFGVLFPSESLPPAEAPAKT